MKMSNQHDDAKGNSKGDAKGDVKGNEHKARTDEDATRKSPFRAGKRADLQHEDTKTDNRADGAKPEVQVKAPGAASNAQSKQQPAKA